MPKEFIFLPWAQTPLASLASDHKAEARRRRVAVQIKATAKDSADNETASSPPTAQDFDLYGAADVLRIDNGFITRMDPPPGCSGLEPNYWPYLEFADADMPWRYSMTGPIGNQAQTWIALIALESGEFKFDDPTDGPLPSITVRSVKSSLPDLRQSWAWAHVQAEGLGQVLENATAAPVESGFSRLLCPRKLNPNTSYSLFLIPTYNAGRKRGLGQDPGSVADWSEPAWVAGQEVDVKLPYFAHWTCTTSGEADFESLARRLAPVTLDSSPAGGPLHARKIRGGETGYYDDYCKPKLTFEALGALRTLGSEPTPFAMDDGLTSRLQKTVNESLAAAVGQSKNGERDPIFVNDDGPDKEDPLFAFPAYGCRFRRTTTVGPPDDKGKWPPDDTWLHQLNLDRRYRLAAGTGARIVRRHQEEFMAQCWAQAGEILAANRLISLVQVAEMLNQRIQDKHLAHLEPNHVIALGDRLRPALLGSEKGLSFSASLDVCGVPSGVVTLAERKILNKRSERVVRAVPGSRRKSVRVVPVLPFPGSDYGIPATRQDGRTAIRNSACWQLRVDCFQAWTNTLFPNADQVQYSQFLFGLRPQPIDLFYMKRIDARKLRQSIVDQVAHMPVRQMRCRIKGANEVNGEAIVPILRGPVITTPISSYLVKESPEDLLPGVGDVPNDTVGLLVEDHAYIEALLVGCNHEINQDLLWREFPSDLRSTVFARFWDRGASSAEAGNDISPIHTWDKPLGAHASGTTGDHVVLVVRGEIVNRYPGLLLMLNQQKVKTAWASGAGTDTPPVFWGDMPPDILFCGFPISEKELRKKLNEYFFLIYQPPGQYRFGVDVATRDKKTPAPSPKRTWNDLSWEDVALQQDCRYVDFTIHPNGMPNDKRWGPDNHSANIASVTFQRPVRLVVPAARLLGNATK